MQHAILRSIDTIDDKQLSLDAMTECIVDEKTQEKHDSEMSYWNKMMRRAKQHKLKKEDLITDAGSFCNAASFKPLPAAELALVNEALNGIGNPMALVVSAPGVYVNRREFRML